MEVRAECPTLCRSRPRAGGPHGRWGGGLPQTRSCGGTKAPNMQRLLGSPRIRSGNVDSCILCKISPRVLPGSPGHPPGPCWWAWAHSPQSPPRLKLQRSGAVRAVHVERRKGQHSSIVGLHSKEATCVSCRQLPRQTEAPCACCVTCSHFAF